MLKENRSIDQQYLAHISEDRRRTQTLQEHLIKTAETARQFASAFGHGDWGYVCGLAHDIGKYSEDFQKRIRGSEKRVDHATAGAVELKNMKAYPAAYCVAGHHAGLPDGGGKADDGSLPTLRGRLKKRIPPYEAFGKEIGLPLLDMPKIVATTRGCFSYAFFIRMIFSCLVDADYLDTEAFMRGMERELKNASMEELHRRLWQKISLWLASNEATSLNGRRTAILKECIRTGKKEQGIYHLTVPTGGGKTISSMAFALEHAVAHELKRIIYVIPYTSIIEQNAEVFRNILGTDQVLEHHSNAEYDGDEFQMLRLATENWDKPVVVTTNVQFFESLFANKSSRCRKLHNIAGSVLIFDEAQMLPSDYLLPCVKVIEELVQNYGCTAVLCTATQPSLQELFLSKNIKGEICPDVRKQFLAFRRSHMVIDRELDKASLIHRLKNEHQALCILNTRDQVQEIYEELCEEEGVFHLSTYMYPEHRRRKLQAIRASLQAGKRCLVIATSLVEAGVDLDFETVYRELAGLDSMIQAAGRCNREGKREAEESFVHIFWFAKEEQKRNDGLKLAIRVSEQILEEYEDITSPEAIEGYFKRLHYFQGDSLDKKGIIKKLDEQRIDTIPFASVAKEFQLIENDTKAIFIVDTPEAVDLKDQLRYGIRSRDVMRAVGRYSVNIYEKVYGNLLAEDALEVLDEQITILKRDELYTEAEGLKVKAERGDAVFF